MPWQANTNFQGCALLDRSTHSRAFWRARTCLRIALRGAPKESDAAERGMRAWQVRTPSRRRGQARQLLPFPKSSRGPSRSGRRGQESCARAGHCARFHLRLAKRSASKDSCFANEATRKPVVWCFRSRSNIVTRSQQGCDCDCRST